MTRRFMASLVVLIPTFLYSQSSSPTGSDTNSAPAILPDSSVVAAIALGQTRKNKRTFGYSGSADCTKFGQLLLSSNNTRIYSVIAQGAFGRIVDASAQATRKYQTFGPGDVLADMRAPSITVGIEQYMDHVSTTVVPVEHVVMRGVDENGKAGPALQPTHVEELPDYYQNLMGAKVETKGVLATFDPRSLPATDLQIVVILSDGECHATLHMKDRDRIR